LVWFCGIGFLLCILIIIQRSWSQKELLEKTVEERTRDLNQAKESLEEDVRKRKHAERELQRYRYLLDKSQEISHLGSWEVDVSTGRLTWSDETYRILGLEPQEAEITYETFLQFIHPDDRDAVDAAYMESIRTNKDTSETEFRIIRERDGAIRIVFVKWYNMRDDSGNIVRSIGMIQDITERKQMEEKLEEMSIYDSLTGLYNRNFFEEEMKRLSDGRHNPLGVIVCDLDGLKFLNDTLGHQAGDHMLANIAEILRQNFRSSDIIARIGGDEFAVLLTETESDEVELMLQRLRDAVRDYNSTEPEMPLSLSVGHALGDGETADIQPLFREADNRMYREKIQHKESARSNILQAIAKTMQARDFDTEGHCDRLQKLAASLAQSLEPSQEFVNDLYLLARFHDLGKVGIPDHILFKPGSLTGKEWQQMRQHCEIGHRIASSVPDLAPIADYILMHHEWWDGRGYPSGLSGEDIPLPCRILAIADAYDAMTSNRPYRNALSGAEAIAELRRCAGTQFDPQLVEQFIQVAKRDDFSSMM